MRSLSHWLLVSLMSTAAFAHEGGDRGNGGDPLLTNRAEIELYLQDSVRQDVAWVLDYVAAIPTGQVDATFQNRVRDWLDAGLKEDVEKSPFRFASECLDLSGKPMGATAKLRDYRGEICWSPDFLVTRQTLRSDLASLAFHEFIHHFGEADTDHLFAARFKDAFQRRLLDDRVTPKLTDSGLIHYKITLELENGAALGSFIIDYRDIDYRQCRRVDTNTIDIVRGMTQTLVCEGSIPRLLGQKPLRILGIVRKRRNSRATVTMELSLDSTPITREPMILTATSTEPNAWKYYLELPLRLLPLDHL